MLTGQHRALPKCVCQLDLISLGLPWHVISEILAPFVVCSSGLCAFPFLAHAIGETTEKANQDIPIRSAGMLSTSTHENKGVPAVTACAGSPARVHAPPSHVDTSGIDHDADRKPMRLQVMDLRKSEGVHVLRTTVSGSLLTQEDSSCFTVIWSPKGHFPFT